MPTTRFQLPGCDEPVVVTLDLEPHGAVTARIGDDELSLEVLTQNAQGGCLLLDGSVYPYRVLRRDDEVLLWMAGQTRVIDVAQSTARRSGDAMSAGGSNSLTAPMPGTILRIAVAPGDTFEADEALVVMESMKMEMTIAASRSGRVAAVDCAVGDLVEMGAVLVRLEVDEDAA